MCDKRPSNGAPSDGLPNERVLREVARLVGGGYWDGHCAILGRPRDEICLTRGGITSVYRRTDKVKPARFMKATVVEYAFVGAQQRHA